MSWASFVIAHLVFVTISNTNPKTNPTKPASNLILAQLFFTEFSAFSSLGLTIHHHFLLVPFQMNKHLSINKI